MPTERAGITDEIEVTLNLKFADPEQWDDPEARDEPEYVEVAEHGLPKGPDPAQWGE